MKDKINVAELLKDCPKGMELDCTMYKNVCFEGLAEDTLIEYPILVNICDGEHHMRLTKEGCWSLHPESKCVIFPKGKTTWEGFTPPCQFKDGDVIAMENECGIHIFIYNHVTDKYGGYGYYVILTSRSNFKINKFCSGKTYRLATEGEKEKLLQAIKNNGYKWNPETKTLEKLIEPKFKVGDRIRHKVNKESPFTITEITDNCYKGGYRYCILIEQQDNFELAPNKFDIATLRTFDKVLVRDCDTDKWNIDFFAYYREDKGDYQCMTFTKNQCIPYESNSYLMGTTDSCREYFKTWK